MNKLIYWLLFSCLLITYACAKKDTSVLAAFDVYCEMVANDAKPMALHYPMEGAALELWWNEMLEIAEKYQVELYREEDFPVSGLFSSAMTKDKTVVLIYQGNRRKQYEQWKADRQAYEGEDRVQLEGFARRLGRLLGYSPQGINQLLSKNTDYRNLASFDVQQQITHLYYKNLAEATAFYNTTLGLKQSDSTTFQISNDAFIQLHPLSAAHPEGQTKSTAIALLTDQLAGWYAYAQAQNISIKYTYKPRDGGPHDGFVAIDPGGYLLEFEQFKQHPENELFIAALAQTSPVETAAQKLNFYASITWTYHNDLLKMQQFYEEVLGYRLVADQGWTKIYQTSKSGFIGLVDERRGMEDYADTKAVEIAWKIRDDEGFNAYARQFWQRYDYREGSFQGPEKYIYRISH
jgi:catechol 2,3-dioxygenase-like lactoylglutathione lyase family enzyme